MSYRTDNHTNFADDLKYLQEMMGIKDLNLLKHLRICDEHYGDIALGFSRTINFKLYDENTALVESDKKKLKRSFR